MQLDLFADSRDVMLRNDLVEALRNRDLAAAGRACAALAAEYPGDALLGPGATLLDRLGQRIAPFAEPLAAQRAVDDMEHRIRDAAVRVFGPDRADAWMAPDWVALARAVAALPWHPGTPGACAAGLLIRAREWQQARAATEAIASWRRMPVALAWMSEISSHLGGLDAAWPLLAELAWLDPARFAALARHLPAPPLQRLLREFDRDFAGDGTADFAWFPAWALVTDPGLAEALRSAQTPFRSPPEQAAHAVIQLLALERQGRHREIVEKRKALRALHAGLFACYMATRA